jgi:hypothetical protein
MSGRTRRWGSTVREVGEVLREPLSLEDYVGGLYDYETADASLHVVRAVVLEQFTYLDVSLNDVLAMRYARDQTAADVLSERVFSRLPMRDRIGMLSEVLTETELQDRWPFLVQVLERVNRLRNALAHGFLQRLDDGGFRVITINRGATKYLLYESRELAWLAWQSKVAHTELRALWAVLIPDSDDWFDPATD